MSAPFPMGPAESALGALGRVLLVPERDDYVPEWYEQHRNPETILVTQKGEPIGAGFTVAEMPAEHRWAVQADGEVLPKDEFQKRYLLWREGWFRYASAEARTGQGGGVPENWKAANEYVPNVREFVSLRPDPRDPSKLIPMNYDPEATRGTVPNRIWDSKEERFLEGEERIQRLLEAKASGLRLLPHEEVDLETAARSGRFSLPSRSEESGLRAQLELLNQLKEDGVLTAEQHSAKVASLFQVEAPAPPQAEPQPEPEPEPEFPAPSVPIAAALATEPERRPRRGFSFALCGEEVNNAQRKKHIDHCDRCQEIRRKK